MQRMIAKTIFKSKVEACPVNACHYTGKHSISFMTNLKLWLQLIQNHARSFFPAFCALPSAVVVLFHSAVAVLFNLNLSSHPFLGQVVDLDLLCSPVLPAQAVLERCPKSSAVDFAVETFDCLLE